MSNTTRGSGPNNDYTGRTISRAVLTPAYAAVISIVTVASTNSVVPAVLTGAVTFNAVISATGTPYIGDTLRFSLTADSSSRVATFGTGFATAGTTVTLAAGKKAIIAFFFDGTAWVEEYRAIGV